MGFRIRSQLIACAALALSVAAAAAATLPTILSPARFRVPSPAWLREGDTFTGTIEALVATEEGASRDARPAEISGVVKLGEWSPEQGIINEITQPVEEGRFVLGGIARGERILRFFLGDGIGAELARVNIFVAPRGMADRVAESFAVPLLVASDGEFLVTGPFSGAEDDPRLLVGGPTARLIWETPRAALFVIPPGPPGLARVELVRTGRPVLRGEIQRVGVRFPPPQPANVSERGEDIRIEALVEGLPPDQGAPGSPPGPKRAEDRPLLQVVFRNASPDTVSGVRTRLPRGWEADGELFIPVFAKSVAADGTVAVRATAHGKSKGPVHIEGRFILEDDLARPSVPLAPAPASS